MYACYILFTRFVRTNSWEFFGWRWNGRPFHPFFATKGPFMALGSIAFLLLGLLSSLTSMDGVKTGDDGMIAWFSSTFRSFKFCCFCEIYQLDSDTGLYFAFWKISFLCYLFTWAWLRFQNSHEEDFPRQGDELVKSWCISWRLTFPLIKRYLCKRKVVIPTMIF